MLEPTKLVPSGSVCEDRYELNCRLDEALTVVVNDDDVVDDDDCVMYSFLPHLTNFIQHLATASLL